MTIFVLLVGLIFATTSINSERNIFFTNKTETFCTIYDLYIDPCSDYTNQICKIPRGEFATIKFNYQLEFYASEPILKIYGVTMRGEGPFSFIEDNAAQYTNCPVYTKRKRLFTYSLPVLEKYPKGTYNIVLKLSGRNKTENECEFIFNLDFI